GGWRGPPSGRRRPLRSVAHTAGSAPAHFRRRLFRMARPGGGTAERAAMTIRLALPSKGRMKDDVLALFATAGLAVVQSADQRSYRGRLEGLGGVEVVFLSASEIARELAVGAV